MEQLERLVQHWRTFSDMPYSNELLVALGALVLLFAIVRIVRNSVMMLIWVLLGSVGLAAVLHGTDRAPWQERTFDGQSVAEMLESGRGRSRDVLEVFCARLDELRAAEAASGERSGGWVR